jgi:hypothetical protein
MSEEKEIKKFASISFRAATLPVFSEPLVRYPWVFYGESNLMPNYLLGQYNNCAIHKAVVTSKVNQIVGDGIVSLNNPMASINLLNGSENINEIARKCALDLVLFGAYALNVIWTRDRKSIAEIYHCDVSRLRMGKMNVEDQIEKYYYSPDWTNIRKFPPEEYDAFHQEKGKPSQIYYYKCYSPNTSYYAIPDYSGGLASIEIDVEIKNFHKNNLRKGMMPSLWVNFVNGIPGEEEQRIITRALEEQYSGTDNAGGAIISFNESKEQSPEITQISPGGNSDYYQQIYDDINRSILSAHRVSSAELFGVATPGKLGGSDEITQHSEYFRKMVIQPYQNELLPTFNKLVSLKFEKPTNFEVKPLSLFITGDVTENPKAIDKPVVPTEVPDPEDYSVNENIKKLSGREYQGLLRIVREYNKGKINRMQAMQMLMSGYALTEEQCAAWLGEEELNYN